MKKTVYIETTIPSYYYETRTDARSVAWREFTREWWDTQRQYFDCYTSVFALREAERPVYPQWESVKSLLEGIPLLPLAAEIAGITEVYIKHFVMPKDSQGDAAHLAAASYHGLDYLLTWNCNNLANANKFEHIAAVNLRLGLMTPVIITPEQLFMEGMNA
jgi:hypothetical protein